MSLAKKTIKKLLKENKSSLMQKRIELNFYNGYKKELWSDTDEEKFNNIEGKIRFWQGKSPTKKKQEEIKIWGEELRAMNEFRMKSAILDQKIEGQDTKTLGKGGKKITMGGLVNDIYLIEKYLENLEKLLKKN